MRTPRRSINIFTHTLFRSVLVPYCHKKIGSICKRPPVCCFSMLIINHEMMTIQLLRYIIHLCFSDIQQSTRGHHELKMDGSIKSLLPYLSLTGLSVQCQPLFLTSVLPMFYSFFMFPRTATSSAPVAKLLVVFCPLS